MTLCYYAVSNLSESLATTARRIPKNQRYGLPSAPGQGSPWPSTRIEGDQELQFTWLLCYGRMVGEQIPKRDIKILSLARSFKCLRGTPGTRGGLWDAVALDTWAAGGASSGEKHSARFVLGVWNPYDEWRCGKFDIYDAIQVWDHAHREAFLRWALDPWFV